MKKFLPLFCLCAFPLSANSAVVDLTLNFDSYPNDVAWNVSDSAASTTLASGSGYDQSLANASTSSTIPNVAPVPAAVSLFELELNIVFDSYPGDIAWELRDSYGVIKAFDRDFDESYAGTTILYRLGLQRVGSDWTFSISDSFGDGLCCDGGAGGYSLLYNSSVLYESDGQFGSGESVAFTIPNAVPVPAAAWLFGSALAGLGWMRRRQVA